MHRQPRPRQHARLAPGTRGGRDAAAAAALYHKSAVEPWLVTGGSSYFLPEFTEEDVCDVRASGVQLVCSVYIPKGVVGFLKQLRVAPFRPSVFNPVMPNYRPFAGNWIGFNPDSEPSDEPIRPNAVWETPFAWENYFDSYDENSKPPSWRWYLKVISGNIADLRAHKTNLPDPGAIPLTEENLLNGQFYESWFLIPDVAVPSQVYSGGIPGSAIGMPWDGQRVQVIQGDELSLHLPIPENTTLALFTRWTQQPIKGVFAGTKVGSGDSRSNYTESAYFPLLPSFGSLLGYNQSSHLLPGKKNAEYGWHG